MLAATSSPTVIPAMEDLPVPEPLAPYMPLIVGIATAILIFVVGWLLAKWTHTLVAKLLRRRHLDESLVRFLASLLQFAVLAATVIAALGQVGVETTSLVALLGSAGIAIGLALQGNLSNFASGVMLLLFRPFTVGDFIEGGGKTGTVDEIGLFATTMTTPENHRVIVPNGQVTSNPITNFTVLGKRRATITVGVAYGSDIDEVVELLLEAARSVELVLTDPEPGVAFTSFGPSSLDFTVHVWALAQDFGPMQHAVRKAVYDRLAAAQVEIPFNQIVVHQAANGKPAQPVLTPSR
jgi:small conductance mechanosensitive channel